MTGCQFEHLGRLFILISSLFSLAAASDCLAASDAAVAAARHACCVCVSF